MIDIFFVERKIEDVCVRSDSSLLDRLGNDDESLQRTMSAKCQVDTKMSTRRTRSSPYRTRICAGVFLYFSASLTIDGCANRSPRTSGAQAWPK